MLEEFLEIKRKYRYTTLGNPNSKKVLYVLHGYGQLVEFFIKNFECLLSKDYFIIAPEGSHRFYLSGSSGRVGASWMTKELREIDIEENIHFLNELHNHLFADSKDKEFFLLGFSQGGATAARFLANVEISFQKFVLWASVFPEDVRVNFEEITKKDELSTYFVLGTKDPYFLNEKASEVCQFYENLNFKLFLFEGEHKIDAKTLLLIFD